MAKKFQRTIQDFECDVCQTHVKGNGYTNHCPCCLSSKHVDVNPGDRASDCHGVMLAESLEIENGTYFIVQRCEACGHTRRNKSAPEDSFEALLALSNGTIADYRRQLLQQKGILPPDERGPASKPVIGAALKRRSRGR